MPRIALGVCVIAAKQRSEEIALLPCPPGLALLGSSGGCSRHAGGYPREDFERSGDAVGRGVRLRRGERQVSQAALRWCCVVVAIAVVAVVVVVAAAAVLTFIHRHNLVRGHNTGSNNFGVEEKS